MAKSKVFRNLKGKVSSVLSIPAEAAGPYSVGASATWFFAGVPCAGARMVVWTVRGTGTGALASSTLNAGNEEDGTGALNAGSAEVTLIGEAGLNIARPNGLRVGAAPTLASALLVHGFLFLSIVNDANAKTAFSVDAEVWYDGDAADDRSSYGQADIVAATY